MQGPLRSSTVGGAPNFQLPNSNGVVFVEIQHENLSRIPAVMYMETLVKPMNR